MFENRGIFLSKMNVHWVRFFREKKAKCRGLGSENLLFSNDSDGQLFCVLYDPSYYEKYLNFKLWNKIVSMLWFEEIYTWLEFEGNNKMWIFKLTIMLIIMKYELLVYRILFH